VVNILTLILNFDNNFPQNLCLFSIRIGEYNARQMNALHCSVAKLKFENTIRI